MRRMTDRAFKGHLWHAWLNNGFNFDGGASSLAGGGGADFNDDDRWRRPCVAGSESVRVSVGGGGWGGRVMNKATCCL